MKIYPFPCILIHSLLGGINLPESNPNMFCHL
jgi:hypothetical protein